MQLGIAGVSASLRARGSVRAPRTVDEVLADYPYLERDDVLAALEHAAAAMNEREVPVERLA